MAKKELYINLSEETRLSFLLMPILDNRIRPWFYENYVNLVMYATRQDRGGVVYMIDFIDNKVDESYQEHMRERIVYSYDEIVGDFIDRIKTNINKDFYFYTNIDKYHIPGNEAYMKEHFVHPALIFGYDDDAGEILCIDQSFTKGASKCNVRYGDFLAAFQEIKTYCAYGADERILDETTICFKLKKDVYIAPFDIKRFLSELHDYLHSTVNKLKERRIYFYSADMTYGMGVYDKFIDEINQFETNHYMTFKSLQDFLRHKQYLLNRFAYIEKLYEIGEKCKNEINRYNEVCQMIDTARSLGIKYDVKERRTPAIRLSKNPEYLRKLENILVRAKKEELEILSNIYAELEQKAVRKDSNTDRSKAEWDFTLSRFIGDISGCRFPDAGNDVFVCTVTGHDPGILYDLKYGLDGDKAKYIYAKYRSTCDSETAQFYFATEDNPALSEVQSKIYTISPNDAAYEHIIDMSDKPEWKGMISQMRFDPLSNDNKSSDGECAVEYVRISDRLPAYGSKKDFVKTQGSNNWSYHTFNGEITYREMQWDDESKAWKGLQFDGLTVDAERQSSRGRYSTVRRWTCPASGRYSIDCAFGQISDGFMTEFVVKRNHVVLEKYIYERQSKLSGEYHSELDLEKGETIGFEFCNENYDSTIYLEADITIAKVI